MSAQHKKSFANIILASAIVFLLAGISHSTSILSQDSPFGIFGAFAQEYYYFNDRMGFTNEDYWVWAENHVRNLGAHWTRSNLQLIWDLIEPELGKGYFWENYQLTDQIIKRIYKPDNSVNWLGVFKGGAAEITKANEEENIRNPLDYPEQYKSFVKAAVERYDGDGIADASPTVKVKYWQVVNEMYEWGKGLEEYIKFVRLIRTAAKEADEEAKIVLMAPLNGKVVDQSLLEVIKELAAKKEFDVIDIHHWGKADDWKMTAIPYYREALDSNGLKDVQIWSTEHGTYQSGPYAVDAWPFQSERDQAESLIKRYVYNLAKGVDKIFWNNLMEWSNFGGQSNSIYNSMGLVSDGQGLGEDPAMFNVPRLSYYTYKKMTETLEGSDWNDIQTIQESDGVYIYKFKRGNKDVWVAWNDNLLEKQITISDMISNQVQITEAVPKYESGKEVVDYNSAFNTETKTANDGKITAILGDKPVFLTGDNFMIDPTSDNTFESSDGTKVEIPADAVSTAAQLIIQTPTNPPGTVSDSSLKLTPVTREIKLSNGTKQFSKAITITLPYSATDVAGMDEQALRLFFYDDANKLWALVPDSSVDTVNKHVRGRVTHLTVFSIAQYLPAISALENFSNYPNPFSPLLGQTTKIRYSLEQDNEVRIRIYDPMGQLVWDRSFPAGQNGGAAGPNEVVWDGKSGDGRQVALGGYICIVEAGGSKFKRKIGVK